MPRQSERQALLDDLASARLDLQLARYQDLIRIAADVVNASDSSLDSDSDLSDANSSDFESNSSEMSIDSVSDRTVDSLWSLLATSDSGFTLPLALNQQIFTFENTITALVDEVEKSRYLSSHYKVPRAPQLQLLEEWALNNDLKRFRRKLRVDPEVFANLVQKIENHPIFINNSNNPQLPVPVQLAVFLNGVGHYGNGAATDDIAEWAGVSVGTVYNCYRRVMVAILQHHDNAIHFDPMELEDQEQREQAKKWVESRSCMEWRGGFLCVDGSPFNLFQKPGWHGEGFFDRKSRYSLSAQVSAVPCVSFKFIVMYSNRLLSFPTTSALSTMSLECLGVFMTQMHSHVLGFIVTQRHSLVRMSGFGPTRPIHPYLGVLYLLNGRAQHQCHPGRKPSIKLYQR